jgi:hypothetical protein
LVGKDYLIFLDGMAINNDFLTDKLKQKYQYLISGEEYNIFESDTFQFNWKDDAEILKINEVVYQFICDAFKEEVVLNNKAIDSNSFKIDINSCKLTEKGILKILKGRFPLYLFKVNSYKTKHFAPLIIFTVTVTIPDEILSMEEYNLLKNYDNWTDDIIIRRWFEDEYYTKKIYPFISKIMDQNKLAWGYNIFCNENDEFAGFYIIFWYKEYFEIADVAYIIENKLVTLGFKVKMLHEFSPNHSHSGSQDRKYTTCYYDLSESDYELIKNVGDFNLTENVINTKTTDEIYKNWLLFIETHPEDKISFLEYYFHQSGLIIDFWNEFLKIFSTPKNSNYEIL